MPSGHELDAGTPERLFGIDVTTVITCPAGHTTSRESTSTVLDMAYSTESAAGAASAGGGPPSAPGASVAATTFAEALRYTLTSTRRTRAWCEGCNAYVLLTQHKAASRLPPLMLLNANVQEPAQRELWARHRGRHGQGQAQPSHHHAWLAERVAIDMARGGGSTAAAAGLTVTDLSGASAVPAGTPGAPAGPGRAAYEYQLVGIIAHVAEPRAAKAAAAAAAAAGGAGAAPATIGSPPASGDIMAQFHYVSCLRVGEAGEYTTGPLAAPAEPASGLPQPPGSGAGWLIFDDFRITPAPTGEVCSFVQRWKTPCQLLFQRCDAGAPRLRSAAEKCVRLTPNQIGAARRAAGFLNPQWAVPHPMAADLTAVPLSVFALPPSIPHQPQLGAAPATDASVLRTVPRSGDLAAMDAEFVAVTTEKSRLLPDGSRRVIEQALLTPGRVSVVDASCGHVFDDYIAATEPVVDHLTRFSGLAPGDLDVAVSRHRLHTFKDTYLKLRALVDGGCIFVGHGLRSDCRTLNLLIPPAQIVDTVKLFKLDGQRNLALKFLASHVLAADIQGGVHDSREDAAMALQLYQRYQATLAAGGPEAVDKMLHELYATGRTTGWKAQPNRAPAAASAEGTSGGGGADSVSPGMARLMPATLAPLGSDRGSHISGGAGSYLTPGGGVIASAAAGVASHGFVPGPALGTGLGQHPWHAAAAATTSASLLPSGAGGGGPYGYGGHEHAASADASGNASAEEAAPAGGRFYPYVEAGGGGRGRGRQDGARGQRDRTDGRAGRGGGREAEQLGGPPAAIPAGAVLVSGFGLPPAAADAARTAAQAHAQAMAARGRGGRGGGRPVAGGGGYEGGGESAISYHDIVGSAAPPAAYGMPPPGAYGGPPPMHPRHQQMPPPVPLQQQQQQAGGMQRRRGGGRGGDADTGEAGPRFGIAGPLLPPSAFPSPAGPGYAVVGGSGGPPGRGYPSGTEPQHAYGGPSGPPPGAVYGYGPAAHEPVGPAFGARGRNPGGPGGAPGTGAGMGNSRQAPQAPQQAPQHHRQWRQ
jgi:DNA polymerase III epsilon subunit-like protein